MNDVSVKLHPDIGTCGVGAILVLFIVSLCLEFCQLLLLLPFVGLHLSLLPHGIATLLDSLLILSR